MHRRRPRLCVRHIRRKKRRWIPQSPYTCRNPEYRSWKRALHARDHHRCQLCGRKQHKGLQAHHIEKKSTYPELAFDPGNGISLCKRCHHKIVDKREGSFAELFRVAIAAGQPLPLAVFDWFNWFLFGVQPVFCKCGCGERVKFLKGKHSQYVLGHFRRKAHVDQTEQGLPVGLPPLWLGEL